MAVSKTFVLMALFFYFCGIQLSLAKKENLETIQNPEQPTGESGGSTALNRTTRQVDGDSRGYRSCFIYRNGKVVVSPRCMSRCNRNSICCLYGGQSICSKEEIKYCCHRERPYSMSHMNDYNGDVDGSEYALLSETIKQTPRQSTELDPDCSQENPSRDDCCGISVPSTCRWDVIEKCCQ